MRDITNFFSKCSYNENFNSTAVELKFTTQKANACSPWTAFSVFDWKYLFWVELFQKIKIISLSRNFVPGRIQICRIPW